MPYSPPVLDNVELQEQGVGLYAPPLLDDVQLQEDLGQTVVIGGDADARAAAGATAEFPLDAFLDVFLTRVVGLDALLVSKLSGVDAGDGDGRAAAYAAQADSAPFDGVIGGFSQIDAQPLDAVATAYRFIQDAVSDGRVGVYGVREVVADALHVIHGIKSFGYDAAVKAFLDTLSLSVDVALASYRDVLDDLDTVVASFVLDTVGYDALVSARRAAASDVDGVVAGFLEPFASVDARVAATRAILSAADVEAFVRFMRAFGGNVRAASRILRPALIVVDVLDQKLTNIVLKEQDAFQADYVPPSLDAVNLQEQQKFTQEEPILFDARTAAGVPGFRQFLSVDAIVHTPKLIEVIGFGSVIVNAGRRVFKLSDSSVRMTVIKTVLADVLMRLGVRVPENQVMSQPLLALVDRIVSLDRLQASKALALLDRHLALEEPEKALLSEIVDRVLKMEKR